MISILLGTQFQWSGECHSRGRVRTNLCLSLFSADTLPLDDDSVLTFDDSECDFARLFPASVSATLLFPMREDD